VSATHGVPGEFELAVVVPAAAKGDRDAQQRLFVQFSPMARAAAFRLLASPSAVDDVVQEAFIEAFAALPRLRHPNGFAAWLRLIVRKHADRVSRRNTPRWSPFSASSAELDPQVIVEERELADVVRDALRQARDSDRLLLGLRYYAGWTEPEIAKAFATSPGVIKKRLHDARRRLRPGLDRFHSSNQGDSMTPFDPDKLLGRRFTPDGAALDGRSQVSLPPTGTRAVRQPAVDMLATGIKAVDVFSPLLRGGNAELIGPEGCGQLVLAGELGDRLAQGNAVTIAAGRGPHPYGASDFASWCAEVESTSTVCVLAEDSDDGWQHAVTTAEAISQAFLDTGRDVLLIIDGKDLPATTLQGRGHAGITAKAASTVLVAAPDAGNQQLKDPDSSYNTSVVFSRALVARGWYPAIHPLASRADWLEQHRSDDRHQLVAAEAALIMDRAERVRLYLTQPFNVAEDFTGKPGVSVSLDTALDDVEAILADETADISAEKLYFQGNLASLSQ
jgi:RNA polymerase sigma factor (sigma-70 family)